MYLMTGRNPKVVRTNRNSKIILMDLILLLVGRNKILQVPASSATGARRPTPRSMRMSAKQGQASVMAVVPLDITRYLVRSQVTSHRNPILIHRILISTGRMNIVAVVEGTPLEADERGLPKTYEPLKMMNVHSGRNPPEKPVIIEFSCGLTRLSINRKQPLMTDPGTDANAMNKQTFDKLFPQVELEESAFSSIVAIV